MSELVHIGQIIKERFQTMEQNITNRVKSVKIVSRTFTPEGGQPIAYKQLVLSVVLNGNVTDVPINMKNASDKILILEAASEPHEPFNQPNQTQTQTTI